ncbi:MAG: flagellar biosynthesis protein FlhA [Alphaproteobacteria bacterium]
MDYSKILAQARSLDVLLAMGVLALIVMFFIPLPAFLLDALIALNITIGLLILLTTLFVQRALEFTAFPMLLLVTTTFRLAINVASTRLVLEQGHTSGAAAGHIIEAFGKVIMGGNFVIGLVIFLVLIIVNFVVITKGSGRIAEVAARFSLDSLPGKQMAIDADLNAGLINEEQAKVRRKDLEQEMGFFGAMDGASKFVRGDAIAGLIITGLNLFVGTGVGVMQHGMTMMDAINRYMVLTIGDGLVAYIPALSISIAAGMLVSKSGSTSEGAGTMVFGQLLGNYKAMFVGAGLTAIISLLPDMPVLPFWLLTAALGSMGWYSYQESIRPPPPTPEQVKAKEDAVKAKTAPPPEPPLASLLHVDTLRLELGYGLLNLLDESKGGRLTEQIKAMRRQMARDIGFVVPSLRIQDNLQQLKPGEYQLYIKEIKAGGGVLEPGMLLAMDPTGGNAPKIDGKPTVEPTFNLPALWIADSQREQAQFNGYTVVDTSNVIVTHLTEVVKDNLAELLTRGELDKLLDEIRPNHGKLIDELMPDKLPKALLQKVLQNLLKERVSIRDLPAIMEALAEMQGVRNVTLLTEHVRQRLGRQLSNQSIAPDGTLQIIALTPAWEREFQEAIHVEGDERQLAMAPEKVQNFLKSARDTFEKMFNQGFQPVLLTSPVVRPFARMLMERTLPSVPVLSQAEINSKMKLKTVGTV